jgi:tRNA G18 (ribose-2'-O)-methylase SpoU
MALIDTPFSAVTVVQGEHVPNPLTEGKSRLYILSYNIAKKTNVGNLVRSAVAFGAHELIVVGERLCWEEISHMGSSFWFVCR